MGYSQGDGAGTIVIQASLRVQADRAALCVALVALAQLFVRGGLEVSQLAHQLVLGGVSWHGLIASGTL